MVRKIKRTIADFFHTDILGINPKDCDGRVLLSDEQLELGNFNYIEVHTKNDEVCSIEFISLYKTFSPEVIEFINRCANTFGPTATGEKGITPNDHILLYKGVFSRLWKKVWVECGPDKEHDGLTALRVTIFSPASTGKIELLSDKSEVTADTKSLHQQPQIKTSKSEQKNTPPFKQEKTAEQIRDEYLRRKANEPFYKRHWWIFLVAIFGCILILSVFVGKNEVSDSQTTPIIKTMTKDEFKQYIIDEGTGHSEFLDSVISRAKETKAIPMLIGYVKDVEKIADKTIEDSLYMDVYNTKEVSVLMEANSVKAKQILPELKKVCRTQYAKSLGNELWEDDINVETSDGGKTIIFTGAVFAANRNIKEFNERFYPTLHDLGFTKAIYKWYKYDEDYTYYTIE